MTRFDGPRILDSRLSLAETIRMSGRPHTMYMEKSLNGPLHRVWTIHFRDMMLSSVLLPFADTTSCETSGT